MTKRACWSSWGGIERSRARNRARARRGAGKRGWLRLREEVGEASGTRPSGTTAAKKAEAKCPDGDESRGRRHIHLAAIRSPPTSRRAGPKQKSWLCEWLALRNTEAAKVTSWGICTEKKGKVRVGLRGRERRREGRREAPPSAMRAATAAVSGGVRPSPGDRGMVAHHELSAVDGGADSDEKPDDAMASRSSWHRRASSHRSTFRSTPSAWRTRRSPYKANGVAFSTQPVITVPSSVRTRRAVVGRWGRAWAGPHRRRTL